jgi:Ca2+-binding RTX toxin-like protein
LRARTQGTATYNVGLTTIESLRLNGGSSNNSFDLTNWTKTLVLAGGGGTDTIVAANDVNYSLSDTLFLRTALPAIAHSTMENAQLTGGASNNTFDISGWTKTATLNGNGGTDKLVVADNVSSTTLTNTLLTHTSRGNVTLASIEAAEITDGAGNNTVNASAFSGELKIDGGAGNDTITGGAGPSLLLGGLGNDTLKSSTGRTVLIGGVGLDKLTGSTNGDLLIAGQTVHDANAAALALILAEWASAASYSDRVAHLTGTAGGLNGSVRLDGSNVIHDNAVDVLLGGAGEDLFFAKQVNAAGSPKDSYTDKTVGESIF